MFRSAVAALFIMLLTSCAKDAAPPADATQRANDANALTLNFQAIAGLNPGASGQPAPVRVRIFELKNTANFTRADYFGLVERAPATLGPDLIDQDEVLLQPGEQLSIKRSLDPATRHVGLVVGYREIDQAQWRAVLDVAPGQRREYQISLDVRAIRTDAAIPTRPAQ
ncbi:MULTISPECIES: type VI secretion system lipoprotein TssJ [Pseudomonas]|jgi:type VI secretion system protein VasD|uniref:Type VI secretion system lipoprotein TssJ n=1 Tax=Pseudomonas folii TaxID=2762593 RepID=A0ABR7AYC4_9PSED|nr:MULTISPECIES: type VI secretion system lipoprotein TssJ [Pseudomonas]MBC3949939.1 type VI secretion system lipoprotein TssJ [Pseudomonas folii]